MDRNSEILELSADDVAEVSGGFFMLSAVLGSVQAGIDKLGSRPKAKNLEDGLSKLDFDVQ